jgi:hypothetical protein
MNNLNSLVKLGFSENPSFTNAGILHLDNSLFTLTGPLGSDRLTIKCKLPECTEKLNDLEVLLNSLE